MPRGLRGSGSQTGLDGGSYTAGECPVDCPVCALCSKRAEEALCQVLATPHDCDCALVRIGNDPCFEPQSCGCYCLTYAGLTAGARLNAT